MKISDLSELEWLIGQWEGIQGNGIYHEEWENINSTEFKGKAYSIKKGEISNVEKLKIHLDDAGLFYTAEVAHNPGPVSFRLTFADENKFVFENPSHDFPKKITYQKNEDNSLVAIIEAEEKGKVQKFEFNLKKL